MNVSNLEAAEDQESTYSTPRVSRFSIELGLKAMFSKGREAQAASSESPLFIGITSPGPWQQLLIDAMLPAYQISEMGSAEPCPVDAMAGHVRMFRGNWPQTAYFKSRKQLRPGANYQPSINAYPGLQYLADAHRDWLRAIVRSHGRVGIRFSAGWGAISHRWIADHGYYFRWLYPKSKSLYVIANPFASWLQYRRENPHATESEKAIVNFAGHWRTAVVDMMERHKAIEATVVPWEQLSQSKTSEELQDHLRLELRLDGIRECLANWSDQTFSDQENFELATIWDRVSDVARHLGYEFAAKRHATAKPAFAKPLGSDNNRPQQPTSQVLEKNSKSNSSCVVLVPYLQKIEPVCEQSLRGLEDKGYVVRRVQGIYAIDVARNILVTQALNDGFEEILWVDDDMSFHPNAVDALRSHGEPLIGGIVAKRGQRSFASIFLDETKKLHLGKGGGVIEVLQMGTGFLLTHRSVYEAILQRFQLPTCVANTGQACVPYFMPEVISTDDGHWYMAEDYSFVYRAKQCGFRILADTSLRLGHIGTYEYAWEDVGLEKKRFNRFSIDM